jgi:hypothetical protein
MPLRDRYPEADALAQRGHWDETTREVVLDRVRNVPRFEFFDPHERTTVEALCARIVPQPHHEPDRRVPIAPWIDRLCRYDQHDGFRFDDMPGTARAWRWGLEGLDQSARALLGRSFADLAGPAQDRVLAAIRRGDPPGAVWARMPARRWWVYVALRQVTGVYYAHPFAWDEIGFGGPAYPRGYMALNFGRPEPWEARERP